MFSGKGIYEAEDTMDLAARSSSADRTGSHLSWRRFAGSLGHAPLGTSAVVGTHLRGGDSSRLTRCQNRCRIGGLHRVGPGPYGAARGTIGSCVHTSSSSDYFSRIPT